MTRLRLAIAALAVIAVEVLAIGWTVTSTAVPVIAGVAR